MHQKTFLRMLLVVIATVFALAAIATSSVPRASKADATANSIEVSSNNADCLCTCNGATLFYQTVSCKGPDGIAIKKQQYCWTKKDCNGKACGTVCESVYTVCDGSANHICN